MQHSITVFVLLCLLMGCQPPTGSTNPPTTTGTGTVPPPSDSTTTPSEPPSTGTTPTGVLSSADAQKAIADRAKAVVAAIAAKDYKLLANFASPQKGLRFAPYTHIDDKDLQLTPQQVAGAGVDTKVYNWGIQDGSGEPIELTVPDYFKRYVYNYDYAKNAQQVSYNEPIGKGNSVNNHREKYPNSIIVEYHIPQNDPQYNGMDWGSLYLIFEPNGNNWELVHIVHGQWTS